MLFSPLFMHADFFFRPQKENAAAGARASRRFGSFRSACTVRASQVRRKRRRPRPGCEEKKKNGCLAKEKESPRDALLSACLVIALLV
jgi:hypothetical protein